jgi:polyphenol oxidase
MLLIRPLIFEQFPEIIFGFNTKIGLSKKAPYFFNVSLSVFDDEETVKKNREFFYKNLNLNKNRIALQKQIHSDIINYVDKGGLIGESDAMITDKKEIGLAISTADCTPVFIYDKKNKIVCGIHSGWRGTELKIVKKTVEKLLSEFNSEPENLYAYLAPSISQKNYEVGEDFADKFAEKYLLSSNGKLMLDVAGNNYDMLIETGLSPKNIQRSSLCSYEMNKLLHSYRRDGLKSGRALGIIAMKDL